MPDHAAVLKRSPAGRRYSEVFPDPSDHPATSLHQTFPNPCGHRSPRCVPPKQAAGTGTLDSVRAPARASCRQRTNPSETHTVRLQQPDEETACRAAAQAGLPSEEISHARADLEDLETNPASNNFLAHPCDSRGRANSDSDRHCSHLLAAAMTFRMD